MENKSEYLSSWTLPKHTILTVATSLIVLVGITGNFLVTFAISNDRRFQTNYYYLVLNLAVCDLVLLLNGTYLLDIYDQINKVHDFIGILCAILVSISRWFYFCEVILVVMIGAFRYRAIVKPFEPQLSMKKLRCIVCLVYVLTFVTTIPRFLSLLFGGVRCSGTWLDNIFYQTYMFTMFVIKLPLPGLILTVLYSRMCWSLYTHHKHFKTVMVTSDASRNCEQSKDESVAARLVHARQVRNTRTVVVSVIIMALFFASNSSMFVIIQLWIQGIHVEGMLWAATWYYLGTSSINPIIYALGDKSLRSGYRKCWQKILYCCKNKFRTNSSVG